TLTEPDTPKVPHLGMRPVDPAVIPALRLLQGRGKRLLLGSNTVLTRRLALREAGVEPLFSALLESCALGVRKPDAAFYELVLHAAKCPADRVLWVGDNPDKDVRGPMRHGMHAVLVAPTGTPSGQEPPEGARTIRHVRHLPDLLETLCG
ncbi:HAD family hydrolase, partial [Actinomadura keratinilytica]